MKPAGNDDLAYEFKRIGLDYNQADQLIKVDDLFTFFKITDKIPNEGDLGVGKLLFNIATVIQERDRPTIDRIFLKIQRDMFQQAGVSLTIEKVWHDHPKKPLPHKDVMIAEILAKEKVAMDQFKNIQRVQSVQNVQNVQSVRKTFTAQDTLVDLSKGPTIRR